MALSFPARTQLGVFPTPLRRDVSLSDALGIDDLWVKRDDLSGFSWGGNKVRPAEFLIADALEKGVTDLVVAGGPSSNFTATMAVAGRMVGIVVHQVAYGTEPDTYPPALQAAHHAGANVIFTGSRDRETMEIAAAELADSLCFGDRTALAIPRGGATSVGALGFVAAAVELRDQMEAVGLHQVTIVLPVGSGGSVTGLLAGRALVDARWSIVGASVSRPVDESMDEILTKAARTGTILGGSMTVSDYSHDFRLVDCRGEGFGIVTADEQSFRRRVSDSTGLLIDHTYNTKPLHWLSEHTTQIEGPIIYWLTGGALCAFSQLSTPTTRPNAQADRPEGNNR